MIGEKSNKDVMKAFAKNLFLLPIILVFLLIFTTLSCASAFRATSIPIVDNSRPKAVIVIPDDASEQLRGVAVVLQDYVERSTAVKLKIISYDNSKQYSDQKRILLGSGLAKVLSVDVSQLNEDGFVIGFPTPEDIVIAGRNDWGTEFGVYEFLERYLGIRWLFPGPRGEYVPKRLGLTIPMKEVRQNPTFVSRQLSGLPNKEQLIWARKNRMHSTIEFHHNLLNLFPPEKYGKSHPEFFPIRGGKRYIPPNNHINGWQPCFSAKGIIEEAIKNICEYFAQHPEATSYSLGVNDSGGFCKCQECQAKNGGRKNFLGLADYSDQYFEWANAVVKGVLKRYPDKLFGCIAYSEVAEPPSRIPVNPRIVPYLTYDRMKWIDPAIEREGKRVTTAWEKKVSSSGWYDYIYGSPYLVPRIYFHKMAQYYGYGAAHAVSGMYAEAYPNWGEGPKLYVALKLQWDTTLNVDSLLQEWFELAVGKEAAPDLESYYRLWDQFWTQTVLKSKWFTPTGQYLMFYNPGYLGMITDEISRSRQLLEAVRAKAKTADQRARADLIMRTFEYYEASAMAYLGLVRKTIEPGKTMEYYVDMDKKRYKLLEEFQTDPVLVQPLRFDNPGYKALQY
jgi:hypothetical protein